MAITFGTTSHLARVTSRTASSFVRHHLSHGHHLSYGITSRMGHLSYGIIFRMASSFVQPSPLSYGITSRMAITSLVWHHISHGHHLSYGHHISRMASHLVWPSPFVWPSHLSYGITSRMAITFRMAITSLVWHHISHGHHLSYGHHISRMASHLVWPSPLVWPSHLSYGITSRMAIVRHHLSQILALLLPSYPLLQAGLGVSCSSAGWTARQFKNTLDKCRILKKIISTTRLLLLVRLLPGFSTNLS